MKGLGVSGLLISGSDFRYENFSRLYKYNLPPPHIRNSAYAPVMYECGFALKRKIVYSQTLVMYDIYLDTEQ